MIIGLSLVFEGQSAVGNMVQVLQPLEVGDSHTTSIDVQVGDDQHVHVLEDFVSSGGCGAVGSFGDDLWRERGSCSGSREGNKISDQC